jgi:Uncharacterised protein family (UPF0158)
MATRVKLSDLMDVFDSPEGFHSYVSRIDGEIFSAGRDNFEFAEQDGTEDDQLPEWQRESVKKLREILGSDDWVHVPDLKFELHEYRLMERFAAEQNDERTSERLLDAINGKGAFRRFKDMIFKLDLRDQWFAYRNSAAEAVAREWLESEGFEAV